MGLPLSLGLQYTTNLVCRPVTAVQWLFFISFTSVTSDWISNIWMEMVGICGWDDRTYQSRCFCKKGLELEYSHGCDVYSSHESPFYCGHLTLTWMPVIHFARQRQDAVFLWNVEIAWQRVLYMSLVIMPHSSGAWLFASLRYRKGNSVSHYKW